MLNSGYSKNSTNDINHIAIQVEKCFVKAILEFYLTSYGDFLLQVKHGFLLLDQCGAFHMPQPRYHLRESQDLSVYEWEEMAAEFTLHASHSIITPLLLFCVTHRSLFSLHGFDLLTQFETACLKGILWKVFRSLSLLSSVKTGPDLAPAPSLLGQLLR